MQDITNAEQSKDQLKAITQIINDGGDNVIFIGGKENPDNKTNFEIATLQTNYIALALEINYDEENDSLPKDLAFVINPKDIDESGNEAILSSIVDLVSEEISNHTGYCFTDCEISVLKVNPEKDLLIITQ